MSGVSFRSLCAWFRSLIARYARQTGVEDQRAGEEEPHRIRYRAAIESLPAETRAIFLLHRAQDMDIATIAAQKGLSSAKVEEHIAEAMLVILTALERET